MKKYWSLGCEKAKQQIYETFLMTNYWYACVSFVEAQVTHSCYRNTFRHSFRNIFLYVRSKKVSEIHNNNQLSFS